MYDLFDMFRMSVCCVYGIESIYEVGFVVWQVSEKLILINDHTPIGTTHMVHDFYWLFLEIGSFYHSAEKYVVSRKNPVPVETSQK